MKRFTKLAITCALMATAAFTFAQGQGRGGFGMRMGGNAGKSQLVYRDDVQADLKVTADQKKKLEDLQEKQRDEMRAAFEEMRNNGGGGFDPEAMRTMMAKRMKEADKNVNAILTAEQQTRLKEIWVQVTGNGVILNEDMQKELAITDAQKKQIKDLESKQQEAMQAVMEKMRNQEIEREEVQTIMKKNSDAMNKELGKLLTAEQAAKLKTMAGKPFKADEPKDGG